MAIWWLVVFLVYMLSDSFCENKLDDFITIKWCTMRKRQDEFSTLWYNCTNVLKELKKPSIEKCLYKNMISFITCST